MRREVRDRGQEKGTIPNKDDSHDKKQVHIQLRDVRQEKSVTRIGKGERRIQIRGKMKTDNKNMRSKHKLKM